MLHCTVITISDIGRGRNEWEPSCGKSLSRSFLCWFHWLRDDFSMQANDVTKKKGIFKNNAVGLQRAVCDRKHHHDPVVLFQSFPSHLVLLTSHHLRLFICCPWSGNKTHSFLFLNEEIRWSIK